MDKPFGDGPEVREGTVVSDLSVTPQYVASTYKTGPRDCENYTFAQKLYAQGVDTEGAFVAEMKTLGVSAKLARRRFSRWLSPEPSSELTAPYAVQCIQDLTRLGVFTLDPDNEGIFSMDKLIAFDYRNPLFKSINLIAYLANILDMGYTQTGQTTAEIRFSESVMTEEFMKLLNALDKRARAAGIEKGVFFEEAKPKRADEIGIARYLARFIHIWSGEGSFSTPPSIQAAVKTLEQSPEDPLALVMANQMISLFIAKRALRTTNKTFLQGGETEAWLGAWHLAKDVKTRKSQAAFTKRLFACTKDLPDAFADGHRIDQRNHYVRSIFPNARQADVSVAREGLKKMIDDAIAELDNASVDR